MYNAKFKKDEDYPKWNPTKIEEVSGRPDWKNSFEKNELYFANGSKSCYVNEKKFKKKNIPCGDYTIQITIPKYQINQQITDSKFVSILNQEKSDLNLQQKILTTLQKKLNYLKL